ncbi:hypothetical protein NDU88_004184 [Pleurodeles waltl]|uniref:Uncharacterized protein n=1 Tax=Pleurodeles waltl TaxID=8319 RepID=A0AAV7L082_PLEWA|nr:hypothetical protein NDU88_004184 [Pleurodeles waltl]
MRHLYPSLCTWHMLSAEQSSWRCDPVTSALMCRIEDGAGCGPWVANGQGAATGIAPSRVRPTANDKVTGEYTARVETAAIHFGAEFTRKTPPDNFAATVTQNVSRDRAVNQLQPRLAAKRIQGSRGEVIGEYTAQIRTAAPHPGAEIARITPTENFAAAATQNGSRDRIVSSRQLQPSDERTRRSRGGEDLHTIHRRTQGAQTPSPPTARTTLRSGTSANAT